MALHAAPARTAPTHDRLRRILSSRLVSALAYPHSIDHYLELVAPSLALTRLRGIVVDVVHETQDVVTLVLATTANFPTYRAGQYVALTVEIDGVRHTRCFTLSSAPERLDGNISITVKARAVGGLVSPYLVKHAKRGMRVGLSAPQGDFVLPRVLPERVMFVSGGSGITPCMSMLRSLAARGYKGPVCFVHFARTPEDVIFADELRVLARCMPNLTLVIRADSESGGVPTLDEAALAALCNDYERWDAWVCGPAPLMDATRRAFAARGAEARVRTEAFVLTVPSMLDGERGVLAFARAHRQLQGDGRTLLEQVEAAGLDGRRGCGMGICMSCRCKKTSGVTRDVRTGQLSTEENDQIQLCTSVAVGDVTLDL